MQEGGLQFFGGSTEDFLMKYIQIQIFVEIFRSKGKWWGKSLQHVKKDSGSMTLRYVDMNRYIIYM